MFRIPFILRRGKTPRSSRRFSVFSFLLIWTLGILLCGCSTTSRRGGASLSDAGTAAARKAEKREEPKEPERKEPIRSEPRTETASGQEQTEGRARENTDPMDREPAPLKLGDPIHDSDAGLALVGAGAAATTSGSPYDSPTSPAAEPEKNPRYQLTPLFSFMGVAGDAYEINRAYGLDFGGYVQKRLRVEGGLRVLEMRFLDSQEAVRGLTDPTELQLEVRVRYYLTPDFTFTGVYLVGGFKWGAFGWDYVEPLEVEDENGEVETIEYDHLWTYTIFAGAGVSPVQLGAFHLGGSFTYGARSLNETTWKGFHNDLFPTVGVWEMRLDASLFF